MTSLLLAEELFLLTHEEESGKASYTALASDNAYAGAILLDLAERAALALDGEHVAVAGEPTGVALLDEAREIIANDKPRDVTGWISRLPGRMKTLHERAGRALAERGILAEEHAKVLGFLPTTRWPERDPEPERALRAWLHDVLVGGATPTEHQAMLVVLLETQGLVPKVVAKEERKMASSTAERLTAEAKAGKLVSASVSQAIRDIQTAVLIACITPAIVTSTITH